MSRRSRSIKPQQTKGAAPKNIVHREIRAVAPEAPTAGRVAVIAHVPSEVTLRDILRASAGIEEAEDALVAAVDLAREDGHTWKVIAQALGVSSQAAHKKYGPTT